MTRAAIHARYSTDLQRDASIEDQIRVCQERIEREGWRLVATNTDRAISGADRSRPGYQKLIEDARKNAFDLVIAEALDRLSRDQDRIAAFYKHLSFAQVRITTVAEGEMSELHVGLKGTMNALFLKDLALNIRRGQRGVIADGRSAGGLAYGYRVARELDSKGEPIRGGRTIDQTETKVIVRIFREYASGRSSRAIAHRLNMDGISVPNRKPWGVSTIHGNWRRGVGIFNNASYAGRLVWNRQQFIKDPRTGRRVTRFNAKAEWIFQDVPELRIVPQQLWDSVKERQRRRQQDVRGDNKQLRLNATHRPHYLFSGLLKCGICGGAYTIIDSKLYGCANHRNRGTCANAVRVPRLLIEKRILDDLKIGSLCLSCFRHLLGSTST
jgi:site-specific DNA recombinase